MVGAAIGRIAASWRVTQQPKQLRQQPLLPTLVVQIWKTSTRSGKLDIRSRNMSTALSDLKNGEFQRTPSSYRHFISRKPGADFPPEAGRYHLYISYACPWASRCYMFLKLKGLEHVISITATKSMWDKTKEDPNDEHHGWAFPADDKEEPGAKPDPLNGAKFIRDLYELADPDYSGRYTVPVLWDTKKKTIVNNESSEITRMFNDEFNEFAKHPEVNLFPEHLKSQIEELHGWTYNSINNGVYRAGFATAQAAYDKAVNELYQALDRCEDILSKQRYIAGNEFTEPDVRLFVTLIRFDEVYVVHFKCNKKCIREYPNVFNYVKDIYQIPGIADTVVMSHIKGHYYRSHPTINKFKIIAAGPDIDYSSPHDRDRFHSS
ncbi:hypothetical protein R1sor_005396 [Riccia sorocarpa]|uniref:GST C-terminal domain-containing protein n=1 Tax=Riccia sorocarpa TaxID=122646 RepID=A0ABD3HNU1_9MARC